MIIGYDIFLNNSHRFPLLWPETVPNIKSWVLAVATNYILKYSDLIDLNNFDLDFGVFHASTTIPDFMHHNLPLYFS